MNIMRCALTSASLSARKWTSDYPTARIEPTPKFVQTQNDTRIDTENKCITKPRKDAYREYRRYRFEQIPEKLQTYDYQIFNNSLKTKIDSYESHDKSITKCYNAISNEKGYGNYCKFDEEIFPEAKKYKNPRCMIHKKTGTCFCDEGPILELI